MLNYANRVIFRTIDARSLEQLEQKLIKDTHYEIMFISDNKIVFKNGNTTSVTFRDGFSEYENYLQYSEKIKMRYLKKIGYLVIKQNGINKQLEQTQQVLLIFLAFFTIVMSIGIVLLSRLFLKPMREYAATLDKFIRDTTHELNTPLSVISMSIERIDTDSLNDTTQKQLRRIKIASKTISNLYNDLTFLVQYKSFQDNIEDVDAAEILHERICYFRELAESKKIVIIENIKPKTLKIDKTKLIRVIDNLLSNAIKYNKRNGVINISLDEESLKVSDTGIGIKEDNLNAVFNLFRRFDDANGGFGIGLNLVKIICDEYGFRILVNSELGVGTTFEIYFV